MRGSTQLINFVGLAVAGAVVAAFKDASKGLGVTIAFDALTFIVSFVTLSPMLTGKKDLSKWENYLKENKSVIQTLYSNQYSEPTDVAPLLQLVLLVN
jgi:hypothetical protein